jgi:carboxyl-terminal processing protease
VTVPVIPRICAVIAALLFPVAPMLPAFADVVPAPLQDVNQSLRLLETSYYEPVPEQVLVDRARVALSEYARLHGVHLTVAPIHTADDATTEAALDDAITNAADTAHGSLTDYSYAAIAGMADAVKDKYTMFFTPADYRKFRDELDPEKISGIGVLISSDANDMIDVSYVVPGTPADRAGVESGDVISTIDGATTKNLSTDDASKLLRGKPGTTVHLDLLRSGAAVPEVDITRSELTPPTVVSKMLPNNIGYVYVIAFGQQTPQEFDLAIERLKNQGAKGLVLDLRNDGGGYVESALQISQRFIASKPLLTVEQRGEAPTTVTADSDDVWIDVPVSVLVNQYTASASEITAGALQDDGIASLIGARTFGKGVMQTLTPLPDGAAIKITTAHYLTPSHRDINLKGIEPDVAVKEPENSRFGEISHDPQLRAALDFLQKKIAAVKTP